MGIYNYDSLSVTKETRWRPNKSIKGAFGVLFVVLGIALLTQGPLILDSIVDSKLILAENSFSYDMWKEVSVPVYMEFYMFNWTNPEEFKDGGKPILEELGPYVYREVRIKVIESWNENGTVTFRQNKTWHFEPSLSKGSLDDVITTVNTVAASAENACKNLDSFTKLLIDSAILSLDTKHYVQATVKEMLFDGYDDPLLNLASMVPSGILPVNIPMTRFGWLHTRNGSADGDGVFNMHTGAEDLKNYGKIARWNYENKTGKFESHCGNLVGSAGELFPPHSSKDEKLSVFSPEICRSIEFNYETEAQVEGISVSRYLISEDIFASPEAKPENWCFCKDQDKTQCAPSGLLDLSSCKWGASAYLSAPHFHQADPVLRGAVSGMQPEPSKHETFIEIENRLGLPLRGAAAFQINILVQETDGFSTFEGIPKTYFPTLWFRQTVQIDDNLGWKLRFLMYLPTLITIISYLCLLAGFVFIILVFTILFRKSPRKSISKYEAIPHLLYV